MQVESKKRSFDLVGLVYLGKMELLLSERA